ncbi:UBP-type zinc finger domain-containing protein [Aliifodinibius sp. S!AR15-10]|uniref:UBP-type zinc finger domain-containing protein n=1 Tax=Aliifodinibius sp. S!AR15-10 TaxID=2950437 RepID=UPI00285CD631|nr:UBP-type zinc finger domain-containing protein [Aliifodinibius sp. S!AR15-10]MDR8391530.1 UBP-type zinc finger domain-containing protein [Aliifodinibius sp. S!AR15-10]
MECSHLDQIEITETDVTVCPQCVEQGDQWVHLRMCLVCGQVGCCDSSKNTHARKHYEETGHPLIRSIEPKETWRYCYPEKLYLNSQNKVVRKG